MPENWGDERSPMERKAGMTRPGEGERRAATGYRAQYRVAADLLLSRLRELEWIKVADPEAGKADDFQLATTSNELHALQVRWSQYPTPFTFAGVVDGANAVAPDLAEAWRALRDANPGRNVRVHLVSNKPFNATQPLRPPTNGAPRHFAAFVHRSFIPLQRLLRDNAESDVTQESAYAEWKEVWARFKTAIQLQGPLFWEFVADFELKLGVPEYAFSAAARTTAQRQRDLAHVADVLFDLVADPEHIVRLTRAELIEKLGWQRRLSVRNRHVFPVPSAYEPNRAAVSMMTNAIDSHAGGYLAVVAPAGAGKSTLLTATELPATRIVYYYAFTPISPDPSTGRGESENFFFDVVNALDKRGLHTPDIVDPRDRLDLKQRFLDQLETAHQEWTTEQRRTILVIDGLDHIPREQNPERSLILDLPEPSQVPEGVFIILGTQTTDVLPTSIRSELGLDGRTIDVPPLTEAEVLAVANQAGPGIWLNPEQRLDLIRVAEGHPLALTYLLEELGDIVVDERQGPTPEAIERASSILSEGSSFAGDIQARYAGYWARIAEHHDLHHLLGIVARLRSPISLEWLLTWNESSVVSRFAETAAPFFIKDGDTWIFIHNSFRLFLRTRTATVGDAYSDELNRRLHSQAADLCARADGRWISYRDEELAQRLHAEQHERVLELATPANLRARINTLAPPGAVDLDVNLALQSAAALIDARAVFRLALMKLELEIRTSVLEPEKLALELVHLGEYETALQHIASGRTLRVDTTAALKAAIAFFDAGLVADGGEILRIVGPLRILLETETHGHYDRDTASIIQWWIAAHVRTRRIEDVFNEVDRLLPPTPDSQDDDEASNEAGDYRNTALWQLAFEAANSDDAEARSNVLRIASEEDPLAAAWAELETETDGSLAAVLDRVDSALRHFGIEPVMTDPQRWSAELLVDVPGRVRLRAAELLVDVSAAPDLARRLITDLAVSFGWTHGDEERKKLWRGYRLQRLRHLLDLPGESPYRHVVTTAWRCSHVHSTALRS